ncbi:MULTISPECIES: hypothetical protein [Sphingomonas]|uniref:Uncharacterized protein n=1 Tax=Sphingomonas aquatilis TaxID=93063 RepID=A0AAW3TT79_9SPHN|nr:MULTISPECIES: hypothetical protein [Sphingomonas]ANC85441.1 hypothetical protein A7E77_00135 [Sphingomonas sp. NIC1]MBB3876123.1 hypothetical protein [Sphingomonas aquatilis]GEM70975.1 hypothetical protein SAQ01S_07410 [Sphingomonas aquatilis NBRC 16722]
MISFETARDLAYAYREVETADKLLAELAEAKTRYKAPDIRDAFGRQQDGLQLGVPSGDSSRRMYNVAWELAVPIVEAHRAASNAKIAALCQKAMAEMHTPQVSA